MNFQYSWGMFTVRGKLKKEQVHGQRVTRAQYEVLFENKRVQNKWWFCQWISHQPLTKELAFSNMLPDEVQKEILLKEMENIDGKSS